MPVIFIWMLGSELRPSCLHAKCFTISLNGFWRLKTLSLHLELIWNNHSLLLSGYGKPWHIHRSPCLQMQCLHRIPQHKFVLHKFLIYYSYCRGSCSGFVGSYYTILLREWWLGRSPYQQHRWDGLTNLTDDWYTLQMTDRPHRWWIDPQRWLIDSTDVR